jgi:hypothetical protein
VRLLYASSEPRPMFEESSITRALNLSAVMHVDVLVEAGAEVPGPGEKPRKLIVIGLAS